jgi:hypothetical protein
MSEQTWTWLILACDLAGLGVYALVIERRIWWGWTLTASLTGLPFLAYSILGPTFRPAFTVLACVWLVVHLRNAYLWKREP